MNKVVRKSEKFTVYAYLKMGRKGLNLKKKNISSNLDLTLEYSTCKTLTILKYINKS